MCFGSSRRDGGRRASFLLAFLASDFVVSLSLSFCAFLSFLDSFMDKDDGSLGDFSSPEESEGRKEGKGGTEAEATRGRVDRTG